MVQKSEKVFRDSLKPLNVWSVKLQNTHYTKTFADFLVLGNKRYLIEVKEVSVYKGYPSFYMERLTQEEDLLNFSKKHSDNVAYVLINFRQNSLKNSYTYLIMIEDYLYIKKQITKKSFNLIDAEKYFKDNRLNVLPGSIWDLSYYIN